MATPIPKKALGQHWLHDTSSLTHIVDLAQIKSDSTVVEIGPGLGTLTEYLVARSKNVTAVEYDYELFNYLQKESKRLFAGNADNLTLVNYDILKFNFSDLPKDYKVVANIPYYLTSNLIRVLSEAPNQPLTITLLIQKEVAERLCAGPGSMSLLSVWAQVYFDCYLGDVVPAALFTPPPKVDSQVVHLVRKQKPSFDAEEIPLLKRIIKAGFSNKRKTLSNSLSAGLHISKDQAMHLLESSNISNRARPQELSLEEWRTLGRVYAASEINQQ